MARNTGGRGVGVARSPRRIPATQKSDFCQKAPWRGMPSLRMSIRLPFGHYSIMITTSGTSIQPPVNPKVFGWSHSRGKSIQIRKDLCRIWSPNSYFKPWPSFSGHIKEKNPSGFSVVCRASNPLCCPTKHSVRPPLLTHIAAPGTLDSEQCWLGATVAPTLQVPARNIASSWAWLCPSPKFIHALLLLLFCQCVPISNTKRKKKKHFPTGRMVSVTNTASEMKQGFYKPESLLPKACTPPSPVCFALCEKCSPPLWWREQALPELQTGSRLSSVSNYWNCMVSTGAVLPDSLEAVCQSFPVLEPLSFQILPSFPLKALFPQFDPYNKSEMRQPPWETPQGIALHSKSETREKRDSRCHTVQTGRWGLS